MLPRSDLSAVAVGRTEPVARTERIGDPGQEEFQRSLAQMAGRPLQATIAARMADGSFIVNLNDTLARMQLPGNLQPGSRLELTLVALHPRPTFQLTGQAGTIAASPAPPGTTPAAAPLTAAAMPVINPAAVASTTTAAGHILPLPKGAAAGLGAPLVTTTPGGNTLPLQSPAAAAQEAALTVLAGRQAAVHSQAHAAALLGKAPLTPAALLPGALPDATPATLSQTAQILSTVLRSAMSQAHAAAIVARTPVASAPGLPPAQMAGALDDAVSMSGLFYESHVAEWSRGERSLEQLAREPQMQHAQQQKALGAEAEAVRRPMTGVDPALAHTIDLQLQVQEHNRVAWQGQVWPGQDMRWDIQRRGDDQSGRADGSAGDEPDSWHSNLVLRFAALGEIGARLVLAGDQITLRIDTHSADIAAVLRARSAELESALHAGSGHYAAVTITSPEQPDE